MDKKIEKTIDKILQNSHEKVQKDLKMKQNKLKNVEILETNHIEGTPFTAVKTTENENYFVIAGKTRILTECKSLDEVIKLYEKPTFENIAFLVESILNFYKDGRN